MQGVWVRRCVVWMSVAIGVFCLALAVHDKATGLRLPAIVILGLAYGLIFAVFLPMDAFGRQIAKLARDKNTMVPRPRPTPASDSRRALALADDTDLHANRRMDADEPSPRFSDGILPSAQLERVRTQDSAILQQLLDEAARELGVLAGTEAQFDEDGHALDYNAEKWLAERSVAAFMIALSGKPIGCCVIEEGLSHSSIKMLYIVQSQRLHGFATQAFERAREYARLTGRCEHLCVNIPKDNARARSFFRSLGFCEAASNPGEWRLDV